MMSDWWGGGGGGGWGGDGGWGGGKDKGGQGWGKDWGKDKGGGGGGGGAPTPTGETFVGVVKSFNQGSNYGFIACSDLAALYGGVDAFFSGKYISGVSVGEAVEFDVGLNSKGQPQAIAVRPTEQQFPGAEEPLAKKMRLM